MRVKMKIYKWVAVLAVILSLLSGSRMASALIWYTSKETAVSMAKSQRKYILLFGGNIGCSHCEAMFSICESTSPYPIRELIEQSYIPWFCYWFYNEECHSYADGLPENAYLPVICIIDPNHSDTYVDRTTDVQDTQVFYSRLLRYSEFDPDSDGMPDIWEVAYFGNISRNGTLDYDNDGLTDLEEYENGTSPVNTDTEGDMMPDGWEVEYGLDPLVDDASGDADGDGFTNLQEYQKSTNPADPKSHPSGAMPWLPLLLE
jgi:hypothetical protein